MKPNSPVQPRSVFSKLVAMVTVVLAAVTAFVAFTLYQSHARYHAQAEATSRNLALALENAMQYHFQEVDLALARARREFSDMHAEGRFTREGFSSFLRSLKERLPQARSIRGSDEFGKVVYGEDIDPSKPVDLSIREFYQRVLTERGLVFGVPVTSRISNEMVFPLVSALTYPDGRFGGTAYVSMTNARISAMIASLDLGPHGVISLVDTQRRLLHRYPELEGAITGMPAQLSPEITRVLESGARQASYITVSKFDGELRRYSVQRIGAYPVYITVGVSERDFLAPWRVEVRNAGAFLLVLVLLSGVLLSRVRDALGRKKATLIELVAKEERLQASLAALTESEMRFRSLTEGLPQMVFTTRDSRHFDFLSHHWSDFTGLSAAALADPSAVELVVHPEDQGRLRDAWSEALAGGREFRCECRLRRHDGAWLYFDNHALAQRDADGNIIAWVGSSTDVTEQREAHQTLLHAKDQALAAVRAKSDFVANMSHEIRSPMNAVLGMLQLLQRTPLEPLQRDYAAKAETSARALLGILNDILDFSKVEEGKLALDPHPFSVDKMLRELAVILSANASGKDIEVLFAVSSELPRWIEGDELRLQQVLLNLAGNAIKFTERGEVVLGVTQVASSDNQIDVHFSVRDTGIGIDADKLTGIFDGFSQAEASTARRYGGTGLGLSISQRLVALMGGTLTVRSAPGQGSTFEFTVSLGRTAQQSEREVNHALRHLRALVVDDNRTGREVLAALVASFGWRVDSVEGGEEALEALARKTYDLVLIDWRMPQLDGWQTCVQLRQRVPPAQAPMVIMVTAHDRELISATGGELAPVLDAMLAKPVTASVLFDTVSAFRLGTSALAAGQAVVAPAQPTGLHSADQRLAGVRLLVVDDNAINQQVARELLGACGARVDVADGGVAAVAAVCDGGTAFDLVLMDIQMPDMDGYAATAAIHARIGSAAPPIVAMTANALVSDRDAAHAAGMVDHVGKPFDLDQLVLLILRHVRQLMSPAPAPRRLNAAAALARLGGSTKVYQLALRGFEGEMDKLTNQLAGAMEGDHADLGAAALHVMKGLAGMIGAEQLANLALEAEQRLKSGSPERWSIIEQVLTEAALAVQAAEAEASGR